MYEFCPTLQLSMPVAVLNTIQTLQVERSSVAHHVETDVTLPPDNRTK